MGARGPVLVTGAAGFVGGHLLDLLLGTGVHVVGWRRPSADRSNERPGVTWMDVELLDRHAVERAIAEVKPSTVFHLAGSAHVAESWKYVRETYEGNVLAAHNLFEGLRSRRLAPRVLVTCTSHVYAPQPRPIREDDELRPASPYATSKLATEMLAQAAFRSDRLPVVIARAFNHIGPGQDPSYVAPGVARQVALIEAGKTEPVLKLGNLEPMRDLMDVRDTVRAYVWMIDRCAPAEPFNVATGRGISVGELVDMFKLRSTRALEIVQDPSRMRRNDVPMLIGDRSLLTSATGWTPEIPLDRTIDDLLDYWRAKVRDES
jgi:GDP-4-dehydro-6-deoxy-D-mannose reductase